MAERTVKHFKGGSHLIHKDGEGPDSEAEGYELWIKVAVNTDSDASATAMAQYFLDNIVGTEEPRILMTNHLTCPLCGDNVFLRDKDAFLAEEEDQCPTCGAELVVVVDDTGEEPFAVAEAVDEKEWN